MPHSGGRVGRGIYLASEQSKSACYVYPATQNKNLVGVMFLVECCLGKEHHIVADEPNLRNPPNGFDSVVAQGRYEPDKNLNTMLKLDGRDVIVPQGKRVLQGKYSNSAFDASEYVIYDAKRHNIRYIVTFDW